MAKLKEELESLITFLNDGGVIAAVNTLAAHMSNEDHNLSHVCTRIQDRDQLRVTAGILAEGLLPLCDTAQEQQALASEEFEVLVENLQTLAKNLPPLLDELEKIAPEILQNRGTEALPPAIAHVRAFAQKSGIAASQLSSFLPPKTLQTEL